MTIRNGMHYRVECYIVGDDVRISSFGYAKHFIEQCFTPFDGIRVTALPPRREEKKGKSIKDNGIPKERKSIIIYYLTHQTFKTALYITVSGLTSLLPPPPLPPSSYSFVMRPNNSSALSPASIIFFLFPLLLAYAINTDV